MQSLLFLVVFLPLVYGFCYKSSGRVDKTGIDFFLLLKLYHKNAITINYVKIIALKLQNSLHCIFSTPQHM